jgi:methionyl aminopeptidase
MLYLMSAFFSYHSYFFSSGKRRPLEETDILTLDLTLFTRAGYHSDTSRTFCSHPFTNDSFALELEGITRSALYSAIKICGPGVPFREIGRTIERVVSRESSGAMSVIKGLTGHGIGKGFHMKPWIMHYGDSTPFSFWAASTHWLCKVTMNREK